MLLAAVAADANAPSFARAGALAGLAPYVSPANVGLARKGLQDPDPMVRIAALDMLDGVPPDQLWPFVSPALSDPIRGVRLRAVSLLSGTPNDRLSGADRDKLDRATQEFIAAQNVERGQARGAGGARQSAYTARRDGRG